MVASKRQVGYKSDITEGDAQGTEVLSGIIFTPRKFSTGSVGWNGNGKAVVKVSGHVYRFQVSGNVIVHKSKAFSKEETEVFLAKAEAFTGNDLRGIVLVPKTFKTGSVGFNASGKVVLKVDGKVMPCQVAVNMTAINSKEWPDQRPAPKKTSRKSA